MIACACVNVADKASKVFIHSYAAVPRVGDIIETHGQHFKVLMIIWRASGEPLLHLEVQEGLTSNGVV